MSWSIRLNMRSGGLLLLVVIVCNGSFHIAKASRDLHQVSSCVVVGSRTLRNCDNPACNCYGSSQGKDCSCSGHCDSTYKTCDGNGQDNQANCDCSGRTLRAQATQAVRQTTQAVQQTTSALTETTGAAAQTVQAATQAVVPPPAAAPTQPAPSQTVAARPASPMILGGWANGIPGLFGLTTNRQPVNGNGGVTTIGGGNTLPIPIIG